MIWLYLVLLLIIVLFIEEDLNFISQCVKYTCLYNNNNDLSLEDFEDITYKQCYYYWNISGPIQIPAPLKYAQVANNFNIKNITGNINDYIKDKPYFI